MIITTINKVSAVDYFLAKKQAQICLTSAIFLKPTRKISLVSKTMLWWQLLY